jgi:hypothetical protein
MVGATLDYLSGIAPETAALVLGGVTMLLAGLVILGGHHHHH